tara:strand:- start:6856 stop:8445 length:1590 start_codon:yes stop_codon:yes gene_type:complete
MSEIAGILNALGRNLEGVDKRRQEMSTRATDLYKQGFNIAPEQQAQGTGNKILQGLFGGTSNPTERATMSLRHPMAQRMLDREATMMAKSWETAETKRYNNLRLRLDEQIRRDNYAIAVAKDSTERAKIKQEQAKKVQELIQNYMTIMSDFEKQAFDLRAKGILTPQDEILIKEQMREETDKMGETVSQVTGLMDLSSAFGGGLTGFINGLGAWLTFALNPNDEEEESVMLALQGKLLEKETITDEVGQPIRDSKGSVLERYVYPDAIRRGLSYGFMQDKSPETGKIEPPIKSVEVNGKTYEVINPLFEPNNLAFREQAGQLLGPYLQGRVRDKVGNIENLRSRITNTYDAMTGRAIGSPSPERTEGLYRGPNQIRVESEEDAMNLLRAVDDELYNKTKTTTNTNTTAESESVGANPILSPRFTTTTTPPFDMANTFSRQGKIESAPAVNQADPLLKSRMTNMKPFEDLGAMLFEMANMNQVGGGLPSRTYTPIDSLYGSDPQQDQQNYMNQYRGSGLHRSSGSLEGLR